MEPIVNGLEERYGGEFEIVRVNIETGRGRSLAREYGVMGQPSFLLFDASGEEVRRLTGPHPQEVFEAEIDRILSQD